MKDSITIVLDRSGSMSPTWADTVGGVKQFLNDQLDVAGREATLTLVVFDDKIETVASNVTLTKDYIRDLVLPAPRGFTSLYDAIGSTIDKLGAQFKKSDDKPDNVYFVVMTDGRENSSYRYSHERVLTMIEHQTNVYSWNFVFLGAELDSVAIATSLGFKPESSAVYATSNYAGAFANTSNAILRSRSTGDTVAYADSERQGML